MSEHFYFNTFESTQISIFKQNKIDKNERFYLNFLLIGLSNRFQTDQSYKIEYIKHENDLVYFYINIIL